MIPQSVRRAAVLVALQGAVVTAAAVVFVIRGLAGADRHIVDGYGNAAWFGIFGGALLAAAWALWTGRRWGRGIAVFAQMLLLPVSWYVGVGSHQWFYAIPVAVVSLLIIFWLLLSRDTIQWISASADSPAPDTR